MLGESGDVSPQLSGFIRICRVLDLMERFDLLVPEPVASPIEQLKLGDKRRKRASNARVPKPAPKQWQWGNEA